MRKKKDIEKKWKKLKMKSENKIFITKEI